MALGFGGSVANLKATLTLDDDGFIRGMSDASAKLDAYNAKLKEEGVSKRLATMASKDYARQLYDEARGVDQATQSHGRLFQTLQMGQRHWKALGVGTAGAAVGVLALTGHIGALTGLLGQLGATALPVATAALTGILTPFTSLAAIVAGLAGPLSALITLFGGVGAGAGFGLYTALTSGNKAFNDLQNRVGNMKHMFHDLGNELGQRFLPFIQGGVTWIEKFIKYADQLANMSLVGAIHSISTHGMDMLKHLNRAIYDTIGRPLMTIFADSFHQAGNRISASFAHILSVWSPLVEKMWGVFTRWFDKQHFTQQGAEWASALVGTAVPVIAQGLWNAVKAQFSQVGGWGKIGMIAGAAFAANFFTGGLLSKGLAAALKGIAGGAGLGGLLGRGAAGAAGGGGVEAGEVAAGAAGGIGTAAIVAAAAPAALIVGGLVYEKYFGHGTQSPKTLLQKQGLSPSGQPTGKGSSEIVGPGLQAAMNKQLIDGAAAAEKYWKVIDKLKPAEASLNGFIKDGGKSVAGWRIAMQQATNQGQDATKAIQGLADNGFISAHKAASDSKAVLQTYIGQEDSIARKATAASQNTAKFGASARAQYAHVAALARTSAQLAAAIDSIPSQKYVSLVLSITENLQTQGNAPGQLRTQQGRPSASGGLITGGTPNRDSVPILAMPGEVVLSKSAVAALGGPYAANSLNMGSPLIHMAAGGVVPPQIPSTVLNAPARFHNPPWYRDDRQLAPRLKAAEHALKHAQHMPNPTGTTKADNDARNARAKAIAAAKARLHDVKARMANNSPKLAQWLSNRVGALDSTMQFNEQTWDAQFQNTGNSAWFDKEQAQRLQEVALYKRAAAYATAHHLNATPYRQASITAWQAYQSAAGQSASAAAGASAAEIASFLSTQQGFLSEFAGNIIIPGAQAVLSGGVMGGSSSGAGGSSVTPKVPNRYLPPAGGPSAGVTIHNHFTQTPPDSFVHIRKAKLQAEAVWS